MTVLPDGLGNSFLFRLLKEWLGGCLAEREYAKWIQESGYGSSFALERGLRDLEEDEEAFMYCFLIKDSSPHFGCQESKSPRGA
jgi:hypothetical protein